MIIATEKYVIIGSSSSLDHFFSQAQKKGCIQFVDTKRKKRALSEQAEFFHEAIKILKQQGHSSVQKSDIPAEDVASAVHNAQDSYLKLLEEKKRLEMEKERIKVFGDFDENELRFIEQKTNRFVQFYSLKAKKQENNTPKELVYIGTAHDLDYFMGIHKEKTSYPGYIEIFIDKPLGLILCDIKDVQKNIEEQERLLREYACYTQLLEQALIARWNQDHLNTAKSYTKKLVEEKIFSVEAYVPVTKKASLDAILQGLPVCAEKVDFDPEEAPPTYMENKGFAKAGEDLVYFYDTPAHDDKDPSSWVFWFFCLFYAMIVADAGYGFLYFLLACFLYKRFSHWTGAKKRAKKLLLTISFFAMGWGVLTGSYFGIDLPFDHPLQKISLLKYLREKKAQYHLEQKDAVFQEWIQKYPEAKNAKNGEQFLYSIQHNIKGKTVYKAVQEFNTAILIEISLLIGVLHLLFSFFRSARENLSGIGWAISMIGGYLYFPKFLYAVSLVSFLHFIPVEKAHFFGAYLLYSGIGLAIAFSLFQHKLFGLLEIANAIQVFADVLSYLRLYALGLAGMIMADTFNQIGMEFGPVLGMLIILIGHSVNLSLGVMGGVIHGLRLNFLEWYHYSFTGGGRAFNPLKLLEK